MTIALANQTKGTIEKNLHYAEKLSMMIQNGDQKKLTAFRRKVYTALCDIPEGKVTTYKLLAKHIGCKSAQAVGQALKNNPYAPMIPCHRVISSDLTIGGFSGARHGIEISKKIKLLKSEGVTFTDDNRIDTSNVHCF